MNSEKRWMANSTLKGTRVSSAGSHLPELGEQWRLRLGLGLRLRLRVEDAALVRAWEECHPLGAPVRTQLWPNRPEHKQ